jgi:chromosome partitioning protein
VISDSYLLDIKKGFLMTEKLNAKMTAVDAAQFLDVTVQSVHKQLKQKELPSYKSQNRVYFGHQTAKELFGINFKQKVLSFQIVKGGVGKTSLSHAFAVRASLYGAKVLCIDLDQQGNLTRAFNVNADEIPVMIDMLSQNLSVEDCIVNVGEGIDVFPSRIENATLDNYIMLNKYPLDRLYKQVIDKVRHKYDIIVFDCPPALGQSVTAATLASDLVVATVTPEQFSLNALQITAKELKTLNKTFDKQVELKVVLNKFDNRNALSSEVLTNILNDQNVKGALCNSFIRICQEFPNTVYAHTNIFDSLKNNSAKEDIDLFTRELLEIDDASIKEKVA